MLQKCDFSRFLYDLIFFIKHVNKRKFLWTIYKKKHVFNVFVVCVIFLTTLWTLSDLLGFDFSYFFGKKIKNRKNRLDNYQKNAETHSKKNRKTNHIEIKNQNWNDKKSLKQWNHRKM